MCELTKQNNSSGCFVCGLENPHSLKTKFYAIGKDILIAKFNSLDEHQSYPGVLHGGIAATILDETIGRTILCEDSELWGVTVELTTKYRKPLPTGTTLYAKAKLIENGTRQFKGVGAILLPDGKPAVTASGRFMKLPITQIAKGGDFLSEWFYVKDEIPVDIPEYVLTFEL